MLTVVCRMLEDKAMARYARWHQAGELYGFFVPDIPAFVTYVLPKYFRGETKVCAHTLSNQ